MIQTQLLKAEPPYQIISAGGHVGIQVATLIVAKEIEPSGNDRVWTHISPQIEYHSYPVVNYGLKQGLEELLKYNNFPFDDDAEYTIRRRMQPEGAVWSGVEVKDVRVLGLAGAENRSVGLDYFVSLIPTIPGTDPSLHLWDKRSTSLIYELYRGLGNVGLKTPKLTNDNSFSQNFPIKLELEFASESEGFYVYVLLKEDTNSIYSGLPDESIYFRCKVTPSSHDSVFDCAATIAEALYGIWQYLPSINLAFSGIVDYSLKGEDYSAVMKQLTSLVEELYESLFFPQQND